MTTDLADRRVLILRAAGINCDLETENAFRLVGASPFRVHINRLMADPKQLDDAEILVVPGGFSYGDAISAGTILANELRSSLRDPILRFLADGKIILGICNGFQILTKAGLLPGFEPFEEPARATVSFNASDRFEDRWVRLRVESQLSPLFRGGQRYLEMPVAHSEGRFVPGEGILERLQDSGQILLRYVDRDGEVAGYPHNPNGSEDHIAGICDPTGRIVGLMPHPERNIYPHHHPRWTREGLRDQSDGIIVFQNALSHCLERRQAKCGSGT